MRQLCCTKRLLSNIQTPIRVFFNIIEYSKQIPLVLNRLAVRLKHPTNLLKCWIVELNEQMFEPPKPPGATRFG